MFESVEEVDQIETEPKSEEAKQVPKMPNGALQNGTSSPDSGHPSSRNFSVTSGLSDGSLSTEDSGAPDTAPRSSAALQATQTPAKPAGEQEGLAEDGQVKGKVKDKEEDERKAPNVTKTAENTEPKTQETVQESKAVEAEEPKLENEDLDALADGKGTEDAIEVSAPATESELDKAAQTQVEETDKMDKSETSESQEVLSAQTKEDIFVDALAPEAEKNLILSADAEVHRARDACFASQKDEAQAMTESDESPSAIEMEEIPKAKVSMVPWSRKGGCDASSFSDDSHVELRQQEEQGNPSPEGTESILSEEPEMESLYPNFDSLAAAEKVKNESTSQETAGGAFSVRTFLLRGRIC